MAFAEEALPQQREVVSDADVRAVRRWAASERRRLEHMAAQVRATRCAAEETEALASGDRPPAAWAAIVERLVADRIATFEQGVALARDSALQIVGGAASVARQARGTGPDRGYAEAWAASLPALRRPASVGELWRRSRGHAVAGQRTASSRFDGNKEHEIVAGEAFQAPPGTGFWSALPEERPSVQRLRRFVPATRT